MLPPEAFELIGKAVAKQFEIYNAKVDAVLARLDADAANCKSEWTELCADLREKMASVRDGTDGKDGLPGTDGKDGAPGKQGEQGIPGSPGPEGKPGLDGKNGADGINGKDADETVVVDRVFARVMECRAEFKGDQGEPGQDGREGAPGIDGTDGRDGLNGKDGTDGKDGEPGMNGKDGAPGLNGKDGSDGADGKDGAPGLDGKDGLGIADATIKGDGTLLIVLTDGTTKSVGSVVGKDGAPGRDGRDGSPGGPPGPEGKEGPPGKDGVSIEDKGVWTQSESYPKGAGVTYGGSFWIAQEDTAEKPGTGKGWRLAVKKGRDGK